MKKTARIAVRLVPRSVVAEMLGCGLSTVNRLDAREMLPRGVKIGSQRKWDVREIEQWVAAGAPTRAEWEKMNNGQSGTPSTRQKPDSPPENVARTEAALAALAAQRAIERLLR